MNSLIKNMAIEFMWNLPPRFTHAIWYFLQHKKRMNWNEPSTYDEKIHWLMTYRLNKDYARYADKYEMRKYVKECGLERYLVTLYGIWNSLEDISFDKLPYPNIIKLTHGSGISTYYVMHSQKDKDACIGKLREGMKNDYSKKCMEYHYHFIKPRIICEELLGNGETLTDYKIVCSKGSPKVVLVCQNRDEGRDYYSLKWEHLEYTRKEYQSGIVIEQPEGLSEMIKVAAKLSKPFELSRIDFYDIAGRIYIGEITLTPSAGDHKNLSQQGERMLGSFINIDTKKRIKVK